MRPKKVIKIIEGSDEYSFSIDLAEKRVDMITRSKVGASSDTVLGMYYVPDIVQIKFYKALKELNNDYNASQQQPPSQ